MPKIGPLELVICLAILTIPCVALPLGVIAIVAIARMFQKRHSPKGIVAQNDRSA